MKNLVYSLAVLAVIGLVGCGGGSAGSAGSGVTSDSSVVVNNEVPQGGSIVSSVSTAGAIIPSNLPAIPSIPE